MKYVVAALFFGSGAGNAERCVAHSTHDTLESAEDARREFDAQCQEVLDALQGKNKGSQVTHYINYELYILDVSEDVDPLGLWIDIAEEAEVQYIRVER